MSGPQSTTLWALAVSWTSPDGSKGNSYSWTFDVSKDGWSTTGGNFFFRRLTAIAQDPPVAQTNGEWFGFAPNINGGPDLSTPEMAYTADVLSGSNVNGQVTLYNSVPQRVPNLQSVVPCGHDAAWHGNNPAPPWPDFNDYEGINEGNPNVTGTFSATPCNVLS